MTNKMPAYFLFSTGYMPVLIFLVCMLYSNLSVTAQILTVPANGGSTKAMISERIGLTDVSIHYGRPAVKGRQGKIWGGIVPEGFGKDAGRTQPWRAGANENTIIAFSTDVIIENTPVPKGKYGFFVAYYPDRCILIFSGNSNSWGSYFYDEKEDVARITVKPLTTESLQERLSYTFEHQTDSSATVLLSWEYKVIPFRVTADLQKTQLASFKNELRTDKGFDPAAWLQYADYLTDHGLLPDEALLYASNAAQASPSFRSLSLLSDILYKAGKNKEADSVMRKAVYFGNPYQVHYYALGRLKKNELSRAEMIFKLNHDKEPELYITNLGLANYYKAAGNNKKARQQAHKALKFAATPNQKDEINTLLKAIE